MTTKNFYRLERDLFSCKRFKKQHLYIIHEARFYLSLNKELYKSQATMASESGCSVSSIGRAITELEKLKIISCSCAKFKQTLKIRISITNLETFVSEECTDLAIGQNDTLLEEVIKKQKIKKENPKPCLQKDVNEGCDYESPTIELSTLAIKDFQQQKEQKYFVDQLCTDEFEFCIYAMKHLEKFKIHLRDNDNIYTGNLTYTDWCNSESNLRETLSTSEEVWTLLANIYNEKGKNKDTVSLPFLLHTHIMDEDEFCHVATNCNSWLDADEPNYDTAQSIFEKRHTKSRLEPLDYPEDLPF